MPNDSKERQLFNHPEIEIFEFNDIPLTDIFLMSEKWMPEYKKALFTVLEGGDYETAGLVGYAAVKAIHDKTIELHWYPNIYTRFHEVRIFLPRDQVVLCMECSTYDKQPRLFVKNSWMEDLYNKTYSIFAMVDAIGVKEAIMNGTLSRDKLVKLRTRIDELASHYPHLSFFSFADSILIKSNWSVRAKHHEQKHYKPELFIRIIPEFQKAYLEILGMQIYTIITQGCNEYYDDPLLHISASQNHISLNSLGIPFAQLMAIDNAARNAIKEKEHLPADIYMDKNFFHSLHFNVEFHDHFPPEAKYNAPMQSGESYYFYSSYQEIMNNLKEEN